MNYIIPLLIISIYLPIFILAFTSKPFKKKFMKVHSKNNNQQLIEVLIGLLYFLVILSSVFSAISYKRLHLLMGALLYIIGLIIAFLGYVSFDQTPKDQLAKNFPYNISRNPTYFYGFIAILGIAVLTTSMPIFVLLIIQFILTDKVIKYEEEYCAKKYKKEYAIYKKKVGRYI
jgi:protein-S-isoprenylcysteine O-methyltransferase Ste14